MHGFLRPPYTGHFHLMVMADDRAEVKISSDKNNMSTTSMVRSSLGLIFSFDL